MLKMCQHPPKTKTKTSKNNNNSNNSPAINCNKQLNKKEPKTPFFFPRVFINPLMIMFRKNPDLSAWRLIIRNNRSGNPLTFLILYKR